MRVVKFGADGIRGIAGEWPLTPQAVRRIGYALGRFLCRESGDLTDPPHVIIGRDNRPSGIELTRNLIDGLLSQGVDVTDLGVMTTPGVAYLTKHENASLGLIVSASHNPPEYNGIKTEGPAGCAQGAAGETTARTTPQSSWQQQG
jgi:phosphoglucosamine mutase